MLPHKCTSDQCLNFDNLLFIGTRIRLHLFLIASSESLRLKLAWMAYWHYRIVMRLFKILYRRGVSIVVFNVLRDLLRYLFARFRGGRRRRRRRWWGRLLSLLITAFLTVLVDVFELLGREVFFRYALELDHLEKREDSLNSHIFVWLLLFKEEVAYFITFAIHYLLLELVVNLDVDSLCQSHFLEPLL